MSGNEVNTHAIFAKERLLSTDVYGSWSRPPCVDTMFTKQLACSFVPCCSALLILSVRARAFGNQLDLSFEASQPNVSGELAGTAGENLGSVTLHSAAASERSLRASAAWGLAQHP